MKVNSSIFKLGTLLLVAMSMATCKVDIPKETESSFETMTITVSDIELPVKFSAKMRASQM